MRNALVTAGGRATRLRPITHTLNKHLIPLAGKPMLFYVIEKLAEAGIERVIVNVNPGERELQRHVGDGSRWGVAITYLEQTGGPKGLGHIITNAERHLGGEPFCFYLGDNIFLGSIRRFIERFERDALHCLLALSRVSDPQRFGVPEIVDGRIVRVEEKPAHPKSPYAVTGIYCYTPEVFAAARAIAPSPRGEYEISDIHSWLIARGCRVGYEEITGWWKDTGKPEDLLEGNQLLLDSPTFAAGNAGATVDRDATVQGRVALGAGAQVLGRSLIRGPAVIGERCVIRDAYVGPYTSLGNDVTVEGTEIEHSIVLDGATLTAPARIVDSIIGAGAFVRSVNGSRPRGKKLIVGDRSVVEV